MWEYNRINFEAVNVSEINKKLNELGLLNWEIIYYEENKPVKFGDTYKIIIVIKRNKQ
jgi:hypothetical protein